MRARSVLEVRVDFFGLITDRQAVLDEPFTVYRGDTFHESCNAGQFLRKAKGDWHSVWYHNSGVWFEILEVEGDVEG